MTNKWASLAVALFIIVVAAFAANYFDLFSDDTFMNSANGYITEDVALEHAEAFLGKDSVAYDSVLRKNTSVEHNFGWVVFYTTPDHAKEIEPSHALPGSGVLIVTRKGEVIDLGPQKRELPIIKNYEKQWSATHE